VYEDVTAAIGRENFASLAAVWPLEEERLANRARWSEFWRQGREAKLKQLLREYGAEYGFSEDAFSPFFANLDAERGSEAGLEDLGDLEVFARLKQRFVQERPECCQVLSFFPDEEALVSKLSAVSERHPGTFLVSRRALSRALSRSVSSEIVYLSGVAVILVPLLAGVLLRSIRLTALALVPVVTGVSAILGMIPLLGFSLNAPSVISAMVAVGLCIDYGILMVYHCHHHVRTGTEKAVTLSAVTTLIGAGVLLFARHPVLFAIGVTMVTGVLAGYASAMLVLPCLYRRLVPEDTRPA
jgi:predicted exporter